MAGGAMLPPPHSTSANTHLPEIRVVVLGDARVGKTSFLRQYLDHVSPSSSLDYEATLLDSYTHIEYCGKRAYRVHFTDCSSSPDFREHRAAYLAKCDVVILMFSALHPKTLTNLPKWMKEVVEARTSTGPARFASTEGDFSEVPIFVVGTTYGEKHRTPSQNAVTFKEAEDVTTECLHLAGYFLDEDDADVEEELRVQRAISKKDQKPTKKKQSPRAFRGFFADLFKGTVGDDDLDEDGGHHHHHHSSKSKSSEKAAKKGKKDEEGKERLHASHSGPTTPPLPQRSSSFEKAHGATEPFGDDARSREESSLLLPVLPAGASPRLPLYMLSNKDSESVETAVRASLALHLWLQQMDYSDEVSPGVTPLTSPRARTSTQPAFSRMPNASTNQNGGSATPVEVGGLTPQHGRSVSAASHASHVSERSAGSFMPSMHALYGSVASLVNLDLSLHHSRATSWGPLTDGNSPLIAGQQQQQPSQLLIAIGGSSLQDVTSPGLEGKTSTEPYESPANAQNKSGPLNGSPWCSPTIYTPGKVEIQSAGNSTTVVLPPAAVVVTPPAAAAAATAKKTAAKESRSPDRLAATSSGQAPEADPQLVQTNTAIFVTSPPNPRRPTAPNTLLRQYTQEEHNNLSISTQCGEYSALSAGLAPSEGAASPGAVNADTAPPKRYPNKFDSVNDFTSRVWRDVDAADHSSERASGAGQTDATAESVVKKLALEHEGRSGATSATTTPQKLDKSASVSPMSRSPRESASVSAPFANDPPSLHSPTVSPHSHATSHTHSRTHSHASPPQAQLPSRSQTRPPPRDEDDLAKSGASVAGSEGANSQALTKAHAPQKQKTKQCTTDGCRVM